MVFSAQAILDRLVFALPLDAHTARATGPLRRAREDTAAIGRSSVSEDGRLLVFPKYEIGAAGVWLRDMRTAQERQLAATPPVPLNPVVSSDGRWAAYTVTKVETGGDDGYGDGYIIETTGGIRRKVCESCSMDLWTRDNRHVVIHEPGWKSLIRVDVVSGARLPLVSTPGGVVDRPMFEPKGRWFTFNGPSG
jgi:hypothetical protein